MYCGIDVAKGKSNICILDKNQQVEAEFEIEHNKDGFQKLEGYLTKDTKIAMETTATYCKALYDYLRKRRYDVCYVDNMQMKTFARLYHPNIKNDRIDAKLIAKYLSSGFKKVQVQKIDELKDLSRLYYKTIKQLTRYKHMFKSQLAIIFPELDKNFCTTSVKAVPNVLLKYPSPKLIAEATDEDILKALREKMINPTRFSIKHAKKLKELARDSIGLLNYQFYCFR